MEKPAEDFKPPTEKQLNYSRRLGVENPVEIDRRELSRMIALAEDDAPASDGQKDFLRELGVNFADNISTKRASALIETAIDIRDQVQVGVQRNYDQQMKEGGFLTEHAIELQLLQELQNRGKPFFIFTLENEEFHYRGKLPISGRLQWTYDISLEDVQWMLINLTSSWAKKLNLPKYAEEYDGEPPSVEFVANELPSDAVNTVHLNVDFGGDDES